MRVAGGWRDYELIDASDGNRLERWGKVLMIRPDPQVIWNTPREHPGWNNADAMYYRSVTGGGSWKYKKEFAREWVVDWNGAMRLTVAPTGFKHTGVFPEQAVNWQQYLDILSKTDRQVRVLNLFGYTGAATVACLMGGASVCHVDASKGMVAAARRNVELNGLEDRPVRYIVDDCEKFVAREIRRNSRYDAVIMDPPSYGRGPNGEVWKLEDKIYDLTTLCRGVLSENPLFFALNSYTTGLAPAVSGYILSSVLSGFLGTVAADEIGLMVTQSRLALPCGSTAMYISQEVSGAKTH